MTPTQPWNRLWATAAHSGGPMSVRRERSRSEEQVVAQFWSGHGPVEVPTGLIHDWIGASFSPGTTAEDVLARVQDYDNHKNINKPEVIASRLSHRGSEFQIYLRFLKKKIVPVVLDTDHEVHYRSLDRMRWVCRSYKTRISEVEKAGSRKERVLPPDTRMVAIILVPHP